MIQFLEQINVSMVVGNNEHWNRSNMHPPILKADFKATVLAITTKILPAITQMMWYFVTLFFQQGMISNLRACRCLSITKYQYNFDWVFKGRWELESFYILSSHPFLRLFPTSTSREDCIDVCFGISPPNMVEYSTSNALRAFLSFDTMEFARTLPWARVNSYDVPYNLNWGSIITATYKKTTHLTYIS